MIDEFSSIHVSLCLSPLKLAAKPKCHEVGKISKSLNKDGNCVRTLRELANDFIHHPFSPFELSGNICSDNLMKSELAVMDFDEGISCDEVLKRCNDYGIPPVIVYSSLSSKSNSIEASKKFRVIWLLIEKVDKNVYGEILNELYMLFPEADKAALRPSQFFYNGRKSKLISTNRIDLKMLFDINTGLRLEGCTSSKQASDTRYRRKNKFEKILSGTSQTYQPLIVKKKRTRKKSGLDVEKVMAISEEFKAFIECSRIVEHEQLFGFYLFLRQYVNGTKIWENSIINNEDIKIGKIYNIQTSAEKKDYFESRTEKFLPENDGGRKYTMLSHILAGKGVVQKFNSNRNYEISLKHSSFALDYFLRDTVSMPNDGTYVINAELGLGKSHTLLGLKNADTIIAAPTHLLAKEHLKKIKSFGIDANYIGQPPKLPDTNQLEYERLLRIGNYTKAVRYLHSLLLDKSKIKSDYGNHDWIQYQLKEYFDSIKDAKTDGVPLIVTHSRAIHSNMNSTKSTLVFDEEPINALLPIGSISIKTYKELVKLYPKHLDFIPYRNETAQGYNVYKTPHIEIDRKEKESLNYKFSEPIFDFINSDYYYINESNVQFIKKHSIPEYDLLIILSATANRDMSKLIYGNNTVFLGTGNVKHSGRRIQINSNSFSRTQMKTDNYKIHIEFIKNNFGDIPIITLKNRKYLFDSENHLHIENAIGSNKYTGKSIAVVGTPHLQVQSYLLYAKALGLEYDSNDIDFKSRRVITEDFDFYFPTFKNADLQKLQLFLIQSQLVQATGRARTIRTDATVYAFTNLPLKGFEQMTLDEAKKLAFENNTFRKAA